MYILRESTASQEVLLGQFVDDTDGKTAETALTIANTDIKIHKAGATTQANKNSGGATHVASGYYYAVLDATDTNTVGSGRIDVAATGALPVVVYFTVLPGATYDLLFGTYDSTIQATAQGGAAGSITLESGASATDDYYNGRWLEIVAGTGSGQTGRFITDYNGTTKVASVDPNWGTSPDATSIYRLYNGPAAPTSIANLTSVNIEAVAGSTQDIATETTLTNMKGATFNSGTDSLEQIRDALTTVDNEIATIDSNVDAILVDTGTTLENHLTDIKGGTFSGATDSLEAIRNRGDAAWVTGAGGTPANQLNTTTIATLASQTSFTLTAGSADDDAYNNMLIVITDSATATQKAVGTISDYVGSTKTVTLASDPGIFTMAVGDNVDIIAIDAATAAPSAAAIRAEIDSNSTQLASIVASLAGTLDANITQINGQTTVDGHTHIATMRLLLAYVAGDSSGFDSNSPQFEAADGSKTRLSATLDSNNNRSMVTADGT